MEEVATTEALARKAWTEAAWRRRWTLWARLSWGWGVDPITAERQVEAWAGQLQGRLPGAAVLVGLHGDTNRQHAHALIFIPRRWVQQSLPLGVEIVGPPRWGPWLQWRYGEVWVQEFKPQGRGRGHGAPEYLARDVGTVMQYGVPPEYRPRRKRSGQRSN